MTRNSLCLCGYEAISDEDLTGHLAEVFMPDDDRGTDGWLHAEAATGPHEASTGAQCVIHCLCGYLAAGLRELDTHLAEVFTPSDQVGHDGIRHAIARTAGE